MAGSLAQIRRWDKPGFYLICLIVIAGVIAVFGIWLSWYSIECPAKQSPWDSWYSKVEFWPCQVWFMPAGFAGLVGAIVGGAAIGVGAYIGIRAAEITRLKVSNEKQQERESEQVIRDKAALTALINEVNRNLVAIRREKIRLRRVNVDHHGKMESDKVFFNRNVLDYTLVRAAGVQQINGNIFRDVNASGLYYEISSAEQACDQIATVLNIKNIDEELFEYDFIDAIIRRVSLYVHDDVYIEERTLDWPKNWKELAQYSLRDSCDEGTLIETGDDEGSPMTSKSL